jgi:hypothetical protein
MKRILTGVATTLILVAMLAATGCTRVRLQDNPSTKTFTETSQVPLKGATGLTVDIVQGVGDLTLRGSAEATDAVRTAFTFAPEAWRPEVSSSVNGTSASLSIRQPDQSGVPLFGDMRNDWVITIPGKVPTDLTLKLGVGTSDVDLRVADITRLSALTGVGDTTIDLSGPRATDLPARIECGVGRLTLRLPKNVGVRVTGRKDGVGNFSADGFIAGANSWENPAYAGSGPKIDVDLVRGVGDVTLVLVD